MAVHSLRAGCRLLTIAFRGNRAKVRYALWLAASLKFLVPFSVLISLGSQLQWTPAAQRIGATSPSPNVVLALEQFSEPFVSDGPIAPSAPQPDADWKLLAIAGTWLAGFASIAYVRCRAWRRIRIAVHLSAQLSIELPIQARLSSGVLEPGVVGWWHPTLLLPQGILERLTPSEFEAVIAHELCHVRRRDNLFAFLHMVVEAVFWFHPLVWWIGARLVSERERACDEHVVSLGNRPDVYADAILNVCKLYAESPLVCVSGVTGADIRERIEAIMSNNAAAGLNLGKKLLLACAGIAAICIPLSTGLVIAMVHAPQMLAQVPPPPRPAAPQLVLTAQQPSVSSAKPADAQQPSKPVESPQPAKAAPKFDAVSIHVCAPGDVTRGRGGAGTVGSAPPPNGLAGYFSVSPGRFNVSCGTLLTMINFAYTEFGGERLVNDAMDPMHANQRIRGVPEWGMSVRYTIEATTDDPVANGPTEPPARDNAASRLMYGPMFQSLLADRFQLKMHRETEEVPMYALTVAKSGLKIKPVGDDDCTEPTHMPNGGTLMSRGLIERLSSGATNPGEKPPCHWMGGNPHGPNRTVLGGTVPLSRLADFLGSFVVDRHVIDKTGVTEQFNFRLEFSPDERTPCTMPGPICQTDPNSDIPPAPSIFTALEQQLGLKLESTKGPHGYFMIDHVERPSEN